MNQRLISERELADHLGLKKSLIRKLRIEKKIPHFDLGYRTVKYDLPSVVAAMKRLEVRPVQRAYSLKKRPFSSEPKGQA